MPDEIVCQTQYMTIMRDSHGVDYIAGDDAVLVVPLDSDGSVLCILEPSAAFGGKALLLPGGIVEQGEPRYITANREMQEEIGLRATRMRSLGELRPWSKYLRVRTSVYLATGLIPKRATGDEDYDIPIVRVPLATFETWIADSRLTDAQTIGALFLARDYHNRHPE
jgi:8-oxo-dGTP pyrophosphatase MutT (NUDIX family)